MSDNLTDDQVRLEVTKQLAKEMAELKRTHDAMVDKRDQLEQAVAEIKASLETKQTAIEDLTREVFVFRSENDALKSELEEWRNGASGTLSNRVQLSIEVLVAHLEEAWNNADADAFAAEFTQDADFVNIRGEYFSGRQSVAEGHAHIFTGIYAGSTIRCTLSHLRALRPGVLLAHLEAALHVPAGPTAGDILAIPSIILVRDGGTWRIASFHNTTRQSKT
jgi:uncharacterized protein (TIGR02246 family)